MQGRLLPLSERHVTVIESVEPHTFAASAHGVCFPCTASPGSAESGSVNVHFRLYQQSGSGSMKHSLRRVALNGSALDKVCGTQDAAAYRRAQHMWASRT